MKKVEILDRFCSELLAGAAQTMSFETICSTIGVRASRVDSCVREYVGVSGKMVTECFRQDLPASLLAPELIQDCASQPH